ncbi:MAG: DUF5655 domain-containing protein [Marinoscillum sp.]
MNHLSVENLAKSFDERQLFQELTFGLDHVQKSEFEIRELYENLKERIINLADNITLNPRKHFVGFKVDGNTFCDVVFQSKSLKIFVNLKVANR